MSRQRRKARKAKRARHALSSVCSTGNAPRSVGAALHTFDGRACAQCGSWYGASYGGCLRMGCPHREQPFADGCGLPMRGALNSGESGIARDYDALDRFPPSQCEPVDRGADPLAGFVKGVGIGTLAVLVGIWVAWLWGAL